VNGRLLSVLYTDPCHRPVSHKFTPRPPRRSPDPNSDRTGGKRRIPSDRAGSAGNTNHGLPDKRTNESERMSVAVDQVPVNELTAARLTRARSPWSSDGFESCPGEIRLHARATVGHCQRADVCSAFHCCSDRPVAIRQQLGRRVPYPTESLTRRPPGGARNAYRTNDPSSGHVPPLPRRPHEQTLIHAVAMQNVGLWRTRVRRLHDLHAMNG